MVWLEIRCHCVFYMVGETMVQIDELLGARGTTCAKIRNEPKKLFIFQGNSIPCHFDNGHVAR